MGSSHDHEDIHDHDLDMDGHHSCGMRHPTPQEQEDLHNTVSLWKKVNSDNKRRIQELRFEIPVQFTVMQAEDMRGNITDQELNQMVSHLNYGFRGSPFHFTLKGIHRSYNDTFFKCRNTLEYKSAFRVGSWETLNVFLCQTFAINYGIYGIADPPTGLPQDEVWDGVILMNPALPKEGASFMLMSNLLIHEVGHWAGLYHTFHVSHSALLVHFLNWIHSNH